MNIRLNGAKRGAFIAKINSLMQEFHHVSADIFLRYQSVWIQHVGLVLAQL